MNNICFVVVGPESSGNRLVARILKAAGCHGYTDVLQPEITKVLTESRKLNRNAVAIRSFPHGAEGEGRGWPDLAEMIRDIRKNDYFPYFVLVIRDFYCTAISQRESGQHVRTVTKARVNIKRAYCKIFQQFNHCFAEHQFIYVTYEGLVLNPQATINWLLQYLGLPRTDVPEEIRDENKKWYKKGGFDA